NPINPLRRKVVCIDLSSRFGVRLLSRIISENIDAVPVFPDNPGHHAPDEATWWYYSRPATTATAAKAARPWIRGHAPAHDYPTEFYVTLARTPFMSSAD